MVTVSPLKVDREKVLISFMILTLIFRYNQSENADDYMDSRKPPAPRSFRKMVNVTVAIDHRKEKGLNSFTVRFLIGLWFGLSDPGILER